MVLIMGMSKDGLTGMSILDRARQSLGQAYSAQAYGNNFFKNDASGHVIIQTPHKMSPEAEKNLRESWERMRRGAGNFHRTAVLQEGVEIKQVSLNAKDAQLLETRKHSIADIASWFKIPSHKLGDVSRVSYSSLEQENQSYLSQAIDPWLVQMEEEFSRKLLTDRDYMSGDVFIEANRNVLLRADIQARFSAYNTALLSGFMNRDEVRALENLNEMPDSIGQSFYTPLNVSLVPALPETEVVEETEEIEDVEEVEETEDMQENSSNLRPMIRASVLRIVKRLQGQLSRMKKSDEPINEHLDGLTTAPIAEELEPFAAVAGRSGEDSALALVTIYAASMRSEFELETVVDAITEKILE
jgi:hypothetical protein